MTSADLRRVQMFSLSSEYLDQPITIGMQSNVVVFSFGGRLLKDVGSGDVTLANTNTIKELPLPIEHMRGNFIDITAPESVGGANGVLAWYSDGRVVINLNKAYQYKTNHYFSGNLTATTDNLDLKNAFYNEIKVQKNLYDVPSESYYNKITVPHKDKHGHLIEIKQGLPKDRTVYGIDKEKPSDFYTRHGNATVVMTGTPRRDGKNATPAGPVLGTKVDPFTKPLAYMSDGTLKSFDNSMGIEDIVKSGAKSVFSAFWPLVEKGKAVPRVKIDGDPVFDKLNAKHPRTIIAQLRDKTILLITVNGRFNKSKGMSYDEMVTFCLKTLKAEFAYNLDGGGSTHQIYKGEYLTPKYDEDNTVERSVGSFLYIQKDDKNIPGNKSRVLSTLKTATEQAIKQYD